MRLGYILSFILITLLGFIIALNIGAKLFSFQVQYPKQIIKDSEVNYLEVTYSKLTGNVVRGKIEGKVDSINNLEGQKIIFCSITESEVYEQNDQKFLDCKNNSSYEAQIDKDNKFSINLYSGTYFLDISSLPRNQISPLKIVVHKGELGKVEINIQKPK